MKRKPKSIIPRNSKEYIELLEVRDEMLKAISMLEKAKAQIIKDEGKTPEQSLIIQKA